MSPLSIAAGIGDSIIPMDNLQVAVSVENNLIFDKDIELPHNLSSFEYETVNQTYGKISLGVLDYINLYTKLGDSICGKIKQKYTDNSTTDIQLKDGFFWGIGGNGSCPFINNLSVGIDLQYNNWRCAVDEIEETGEIASDISGQVKNQEFQLALFIAREFDLVKDEISVTPYVGGVYNYFKSKSDAIKYKNSSTSYERSWDSHGNDEWGVLVGTDIVSNDILVINIEGRFIEETAVTAGASWKF